MPHNVIDRVHKLAHYNPMGAEIWYQNNLPSTDNNSDSTENDWDTRYTTSDTEDNYHTTGVYGDK